MVFFFRYSETPGVGLESAGRRINSQALYQLNYPGMTDL